MARLKRCVGMLLVGVLTGGTAAGQELGSSAPEKSDLHSYQAMVMLDYQVIRVPGDKPIDLMGFHIQNKVANRLFLGVGAYAPLVKGAYGGFMAFDIDAHFQQPLTSRLFATAGVSAGGGGGGRSLEQSKLLSGTGGFFKGYVGLGYDFSRFSVGANISRVKFISSAIDGTQANVFIQIPYSYLTGPYSSQGQTLSAADARLAAAGSGENMLTLVFDRLRQVAPEGSYKGTINVADLQYAHYFATDTYWYAGLGVGFHGLPLYNQLLGGVGQRLRLSPKFTLYGQLGIGSGGYAPEVINTDAGLLVYPKVSVEYALTRELGLALSAGYMVAPKGTARNQTIGLALTHHLRSGDGGGSESDSPAIFQAFRFSVLQQTEYHVRYGDLASNPLHMLGIQLDRLLSEHWYIPLQATVAYNAYHGYPGYGELLAGIGLQTRASPANRVQLFSQLMVGTNVHGPAVKACGGLRYGLSDHWAVQLSAGKTVAQESAGKRFSADSVALGLDYRFSIPSW